MAGASTGHFGSLIPDPVAVVHASHLRKPAAQSWNSRSAGMSSSESDVPPISAGPTASVVRRPCPPHADGTMSTGRRRQLRGDGADRGAVPCALAVIIDDGTARWRHEFVANAVGCRELLDERRRQAGLTSGACEAEQRTMRTRGAGCTLALGIAVFMACGLAPRVGR